MADNIVTIEDVYFQRGERDIFTGLSLTVPVGKVVAIMGPSGTGKTTLLRLIAGLLSPSSGQVLVKDQDVNQLPRLELLKLRERMGMLFQGGGLFTDMNVFDNVAFPLRMHTPLPESMIRDIVLMKLEAVGLRGAQGLMPAELSGGMSRRVALARAIALDPDIVMYDEPFTGQDPIAMGVLVRLISALNKALGITSIIVSHDVGETLSIADYAYVVANGKVIGQGTPAELYAQTQPDLQQFIQGLADGPVAFHYPAADLAKDLQLD
ncbi:MAG: ATP-binding cassette domain-containing protein [Gammaproteobacteria bacterium]